MYSVIYIYVCTTFGIHFNAVDLEWKAKYFREKQRTTALNDDLLHTRKELDTLTSLQQLPSKQAGTWPFVCVCVAYDTASNKHQSVQYFISCTLTRM